MCWQNKNQNSKRPGKICGGDAEVGHLLCALTYQLYFFSTVLFPWQKCRRIYNRLYNNVLQLIACCIFSCPLFQKTNLFVPSRGRNLPSPAPKQENTARYIEVRSLIMCVKLHMAETAVIHSWQKRSHLQHSAVDTKASVTSQAVYILKKPFGEPCQTLRDNSLWGFHCKFGTLW